MRMFPIAAALLCSASLLCAQDETYEQLVADYEVARQQDLDAAVAEFVPRFAAAAAGHRGGEAAVPFLAWIVQNGPFAKVAEEALDALAAEHGASLALGPVLEVLPNVSPHLGEERCARLVEAVLAASSPPELHARALLARATMVMMRATGSTTTSAPGALDRTVDTLLSERADAGR